MAKPSANDIAPEQPNNEQPASKATLQGGYECTLVEKPPEHLQTECSVCLCLLRDPHLVDCCGYSFCESCIESVKAANKSCPLCNTPFTTVLPDKRLQRQLNGLRVHCSNKATGCEWVSELGTLDQHLNVEDQSDDKYVGCKFNILTCSYCDEKHQRQNVEKHEKEECRYRPYSCDYCYDYSSTCEDDTVNHWPVCGSRPVPCPNECGVYPELQDLENHVAEKCPLQVVNCDFDYVGCETKLLRKEMPEHVNTSLGTHMSLLAISHKKQLNKLEEENKHLRHEVEVLSRVPPLQFRLEGFTQHKLAQECWTSPPFYSHLRGYKMCLRVYPKSDDFIGVFVHIMKSEFDHTLKWPFQGFIRVVLVNQDDDHDLMQRLIIPFNKSNSAYVARVLDQETSAGGIGSPTFIAHDQLTQPGARYLVNDCLYFRIDKVEILSDC